MPTKIAINGFGRIGRAVFKIILDQHPDLEVVAINDLTDPATLTHLCQYDSVYGVYPKKLSAEGSEMIVQGAGKVLARVRLLAESDPQKLPWAQMGVKVVLECTGIYTDGAGCGKHLAAGAVKVVISAPAKSDDIPTYLLGVNQEKYQPSKDQIISMGSCTTNCLAPIVKILHQSFGVVSGFMTTVHSYTNDQRILDLPHKDWRRARAAALNIIPTTTGAAKTVAKCLPDLEGKLDGLSLRVPTPTVSITDFVCTVAKTVTVESINQVLQHAANQELKGIMAYESGELVSSDFKGSPYSSIIDGPSTAVIGNLVKTLAWYDNEYGYSCRLAEMAELVAQGLK